MITYPWTDLNGAYGHVFAGAAMSQSYANLYWLSRLFLRHPHLKGALELGTLNGAFASFLGMHFPGCTWTVDIKDARPESTRRLHEKLGIRYRGLDCRYTMNMEILLAEVFSPSFIFCDNGAKEDEFAICVPKLAPRDIIGVHDLYSEFNPERPELARLIERCGLRRLTGRDFGEDELVTPLYRETETHSAYWIKE